MISHKSWMTNMTSPWLRPTKDLVGQDYGVRPIPLPFFHTLCIHQWCITQHIINV